MDCARLHTAHLTLWPLAPAAAELLPGHRAAAAAIIGAELSADWPATDLLDVLPMQASTPLEEAHYGLWVIVEQATGVVIGDMGFFGPPGADHTLELGYSIVPDRRRRGYATEAARALIAWAQEQPNVEGAVARCDEDNLPSIRTLERVGFAPDGETEGQLRWRLAFKTG